MRHIRIPVSIELLERALQLPTDMQIVGIKDDFQRAPTMMVLEVAHPQLPDVPDDMEPPRVTPILTTHVARIEWKIGDVVLDGRRPL